MTVDASRSCLGLGTCVGSAIRQIVDARVLPTATVPPALPGRSVSYGSLAPPAVAGIMRFLCSACRRHAAGDGPDKPRQANRCDVSVSAETPCVSAACDGVTVCKADPGEDDEFQERAAIREFDGGLPRAEAEIGKAQTRHY
jgi:hypothetical protein